MLDKFQIATALREIAMLLPLKGENPFKARAYDRGADAVEALVDDMGELVDEQRLTGVENIGEALAAKIAELYLTGRCAYLERLRDELPPGIIELSQVPHLGVKKIQALREALGIASVAQLKEACLAGRVREVKGFGAKTELKIQDGIRLYEERQVRVLLVDALEIGERLLQHLRASPAVAQAELAGSVRRRQETAGNLDVVVALSDAATATATAVFDQLERFPLVMRVESRDAAECKARLASGLPVDLRVVTRDRFAAALHRYTGSPAHTARLVELAAVRKQSLPDSVASEEDLYAELGLPYIPPELREDAGEIEAGLAGERWQDLVTLADVRGMVHCHTVYSDGQNTIEEMARAADELGMEYLTITDHSPAAHYAQGVTFDRLERQWDEIARVQEGVKVKLLRGTESDILETGALDYPDDVLERFDVIIASIHSRFKMDEAQMTRRLVTAMRNPVFKVWGHALGRLVLRRDPIACRVEEVLDAVAESRAAIEVNGDPHRLDLAPRWIREARKRGIRFVISTDAHSVRGMSYLPFGVWMARRGGLRRGEVLNTLPAAAFLEAVRPVG